MEILVRTVASNPTTFLFPFLINSWCRSYTWKCWQSHATTHPVIINAYIIVVYVSHPFSDNCIGSVEHVWRSSRQEGWRVQEKEGRRIFRKETIILWTTKLRLIDNNMSPRLFQKLPSSCWKQSSSTLSEMFTMELLFRIV